MIVLLAWVLGVAGLAWALWCAVSAAVDQAPTYPHRLGLVVLEVLALVQAVIAVVLLVVSPGRAAGAVAEIVGYLIALLVVLPIGAALAYGERNRYGSVVLAIAGVTYAVLVLRTTQVWDVTGV
ncbi:hypothetical protein GCM10023201_40080 [Actinomycetospora corticicola]|uniref:Integral membrane protein n=1 Tax=Actinomycetospora corticicola TaxID=663602 RepID=A0A7Y9J662_9PSEU|nr:hypothetical protein [Actinomycetospora corticicola]NYD36908.1 hypothetical protein [Actinomycetospora corticicola]